MSLVQHPPSAHLSVTTLTARDVAVTPLPALLAATRAQVITSSITDVDFFGAAVDRGDGSLLLALPSGRGEAERDVIARGLLAARLGVDIGLPSSIRFSEVPA